MNPFIQRAAARKRQHVVAGIHFERREPADAGTLDCTCGWFGWVRDWPHAPGLSVAYAWKDDAWGGPRLHMPNARVIGL